MCGNWRQKLKLIDMKNLVVLILSITFLISCNNDYNLPDTNVSPNLNSTKSFELSEDDAQKILLSFLNNQEDKTLKSTSESLKIRNISKDNYKLEKNATQQKSTVAGTDTCIPIYNFTIEDASNNRGFALVSGDLRVPSVLSLSMEGSLSDTVYNKALALWYDVYLKDYLKEQLSNFNLVRDSILNLQNTNTKFASTYDPLFDGWILCGDVIWSETSSVINYANDLRIEQKRVSDSGQLIKVAWNQTAPYNGNFPTINCEGSNMVAYAGCTTLAVTQIMSYYRKPTNYDWNILNSQVSIPSTSTNVQLLSSIRTLMINVGNSLKLNYKCDGSGASIDNVLNTLKSFGYSGNIVGASYNNYNTHKTVGDELKASRPVYHQGFKGSSSGHAWIVDGYQDYIVNYYAQLKVVNKQTGAITNNPWGMIFGNNNLHSILYHVNFGWGGSNNGWYAYPCGGSDYSSNQQLIINIK